MKKNEKPKNRGFCVVYTLNLNKIVDPTVELVSVASYHLLSVRK